ncbi:tetratricopeptide repeat protein [Caulobacter segnis]|uniref:TPR repeat-containing protein n=2 Tax=Caulobacter segnis TaxID=88688 RepID=D5VMZ3_CAUST|nr:tetratricopeptide repeat protein [Caulobacter segnis]ADG11866.1 TPR repeat-containing protein [Caulobacter segnis ATCC 21756]AVQ03498.1 tetratricopeptide repeat protein [Caulobacter segnis]
MCRKRARLATVLAPAALALAALCASDGALAADAPVKASPQQRGEARRLDPLARAAFWGSEFQADAADAEAGAGLAQALRGLGRNDDAAEVATQALVAHPDDEALLLELARAHIARGQGFYAIDPARKAASLAPKDWRPLTLLAVAYEQAERGDEAEAAHRQALALAPSEATPLTNYAMHLAAKGDLAGAEAQLRRAVALPSAGIQVRQNLALVVGLQGRLPEAEKLARADLPPEQVANNLAYLRAALGQAGGGRTWDALRAGGGQ